MMQNVQNVQNSVSQNLKNNLSPNVDKCIVLKWDFYLKEDNFIRNKKPKFNKHIWFLKIYADPSWMESNDKLICCSKSNEKKSSGHILP